MLKYTVFKCFCEATYNYDQMKNGHYRQCEKFKERFGEIDKSISESIKNYVELLDPLNKQDYNNGLIMLKFILKRYVNLIGKLYKENNKNENENDFQKGFNFNLTKNISADLPKIDNSFNNLGVTQIDIIHHNNQFTNISNNKNFVSNNLNISQIESNNMNKEEMDIIYKYYEKINEYNNMKNKLDDLDLIAKNISNLLLNDCLVFTVDDSGEIKFATNADIDKYDTKFYKCKIDDKRLYAIFLE